jgi:DNA-binding transcriptional LysR family regulator
MSADDMAVFVRVVEREGFSAAAGGLGLTPSAVSKIITRLEARLGVRLLQRTTRALRLTADGEVYYEEARRLVGEIATLEGRLSDGSGMPQGLLRVTTPLTFSTYQLAPVIGEFLARYPAIRLELLPTDRQLDMVEEGIDVAIRIGRLSDSSFTARKIGDDFRLICASPDYIARHGAPQRPEDLLDHACICSGGANLSLNRWPFGVDGHVHEIEVAGPVAVNEGEAQLHLALQGIGIARLTRLTLVQAIASGRLVPLLRDYSADQPVPIHALYPNRRHLAPKVSAFVNFLAEKIAPVLSEIPAAAKA